MSEPLKGLSRLKDVERAGFLNAQGNIDAMNVIINYLNKAISRINELEAKLEHVHELDIGDTIVGTPLVAAEDNEGNKIWKPL